MFTEIMKKIWSPLESTESCDLDNPGIAMAQIVRCAACNAGKIFGRVATVGGATAISALAVKTLAAAHLSATAAAMLTKIAVVGAGVTATAILIPGLALSTFGVLGFVLSSKVN